MLIITKGDDSPDEQASTPVTVAAPPAAQTALIPMAPVAEVTPRGTTGHSRQVPWGVGKYVGGHAKMEQFSTTRAAMADAGLDWTVKLGDMTAFLPDGSPIGVPSHRAVQRTDTGKILGVVSPRYTPVQNRRLAEFTDVLVDASNGNRSAMGEAFGGSRVYTVTKLGDIDSPDGGLGSFLVAATSHDGSSSMYVTVVNVRWACTNGLVGLSDLAHTVKIRHTAKAEERLVEAQRIMAGASSYLVDTTRIMEELLDTPVSAEVGEAWIRHVLAPLPDTNSKPAIANAERKQSELLSTWKHSDNLNDVRDTGWGFLNAVAEWNEWTGSGVQRRQRTPMERLLTGSGQDIVHQARDLVLA